MCLPIAHGVECVGAGLLAMQARSNSDQLSPGLKTAGLW